MNTESESHPPHKTGHELHSIYDVLHALVDKEVTIVNADALLGSAAGKLRIDHAVYQGKIRAVTTELLVLFTEFDERGRGDHGELAKEFIPLSQVKRVSVAKGMTNIHI